MKNQTFITYKGDHADADLLASQAQAFNLPDAYVALLKDVNGFVQFNGGVHVRGVVESPAWHSLANAMQGEDAFHKLYEMILPTDICFAEDCVGSQYFLRDGSVWFLDAQTGDLEDIEMDFEKFIVEMQEMPVQMLGMYPVLQFQDQDKTLKPGELLAETPYLFTKEAEKGVDLAAVETLSYRHQLAKVCEKVQSLPEDADYAMADFEGI